MAPSAADGAPFPLFRVKRHEFYISETGCWDAPVGPDLTLPPPFGRSAVERIPILGPEYTDFRI